MNPVRHHDNARPDIVLGVYESDPVSQQDSQHPIPEHPLRHPKAEVDSLVLFPSL